MKRFLLFILLLTITLFAKAQPADSAKLIGIHPAVGKTITQDEKINYHLFPEYKDSVFESAQIFRYNDSTYEIVIRSTAGAELKSPAGIAQMNDLYDQVERVEQAGREPEYVETGTDKKAERRADSSRFWFNLLGEITIIALQTLITIVIAN